MQYLHQNFDKNDILRVVRALAIFRPSLIALQMPLTEEDEIFVEKCFQRSLIVRTVTNGLFILLTSFDTGARKAYLVQWHSNSCLETYWRDMSRWHGIQHANGMEPGRARRPAKIYLRGP